MKTLIKEQKKSTTQSNFNVNHCKFTIEFFTKIDHSGSAARIVLEQNKFSKKVTSNRD